MWDNSDNSDKKGDNMSIFKEKVGRPSKQKYIEKIFSRMVKIYPRISIQYLKDSYAYEKPNISFKDWLLHRLVAMKIARRYNKHKGHFYL